MTDKADLEETLNFAPCFDAGGLIPCITTSAKTGKVLMFAFMNQEALDKTVQTGEVHYWSRSRNELWHKGATSGHTQKVIEIRTDCDQDCVWISVEMNPEISCHTDRQGCFYRKVDLEFSSKQTQLEFIDDEKL